MVCPMVRSVGEIFKVLVQRGVGLWYGGHVLKVFVFGNPGRGAGNELVVGVDF